MARMRMVTRTVNVVDVTVLAVDITVPATKNMVYTMSGTFDSDVDLLKAVQKQHDEPMLKNVSIISKTEREILYGMPESQFIRLASILPPRKAGETVDD